MTVIGLCLAISPFIVWLALVFLLAFGPVER